MLGNVDPPFTCRRNKQ